MKTLKEKVVDYNTEIKTALQMLYDELPQGQQKKVMKNKAVKELLERYGVK